AIDGQIGKPKVAVLAERVRLINPACHIEAITEFLPRIMVYSLLDPRFDFVVDAIDKLGNKCLLIDGCVRRGLKVITVGGAGGKRDATAVRVRDLAPTEQDEVLRQLRRKLRRDFSFAPGAHTSAPLTQATFGIPAVFSPETPVYPCAYR